MAVKPQATGWAVYYQGDLTIKMSEIIKNKMIQKNSCLPISLGSLGLKMVSVCKKPSCDPIRRLLVWALVLADRVASGERSLLTLVFRREARVIHCGSWCLHLEKPPIMVHCPILSDQQQSKVEHGSVPCHYLKSLKEHSKNIPIFNHTLWTTKGPHELHNGSRSQGPIVRM